MVSIKICEKIFNFFQKTNHLMFIKHQINVYFISIYLSAILKNHPIYKNKI